jgi:hypothetical protein
MFATLILIACLDTASPGTCIDVEVQASTNSPMTAFSCMGHEGQNIAREFMAQHPVYSHQQFGGWRCKIANKPPKHEHSA